MERRPVEWLAAPDDEEEDGPDERFPTMRFRLADEWTATDQDQLLLPIVVLEKTGVEVEDGGYPAILKQYGGEGLLNDMLMADCEVEAGSEWTLMRTDSLLTVEPAD